MPLNVAPTPENVEADTAPVIANVVPLTFPVNIPAAPANVPADTIPLNSAAVPLTLPVNAAPLTTVS